MSRAPEVYRGRREGVTRANPVGVRLRGGELVVPAFGVWSQSKTENYDFDFGMEIGRRDPDEEQSVENPVRERLG